MNRYYAYIRYSDPKQETGVSLEAQIDAIERHAAQNNLTIVKWFVEKRTAAKTGRPVFSRMIKLLQASKADGMIMHKVDRSARNLVDWGLIGDLSDQGIDVHIANESLDFRSRGGRLSADIQAVIAADYIRNLREECIKGMRGRLKQGLYPFGAPIGYLDQGRGQLKTPDPERADLVKQAFELYGSGQHSLRSLTIAMREAGLRNKRGNPLSVHGIESLLSNPFYCGLMRVKTTGETYEGKHQHLISPSLFERVQDIRQGRSGKKVTRHNHTYRGLFRCGLCKAAMTPEKQKGRVYYRCQTPGCATKTVREDRIENEVYSLFNTLTLPKGHVRRLQSEIALWLKRKSSAQSLNGNQRKLSDIATRLEKLEDAAIAEIIDRDGFEKRKKVLLLEKAKIEEALRNEFKTHQIPGHIEKFLELINSLSRSYEIAKPARKREFVELFTSNRTIEGRSIKLEPQNWLLAAEQAVAVTCGDPHRHTSRTEREKVDTQIEALIDAATACHEQTGTKEAITSQSQCA